MLDLLITELFISEFSRLWSVKNGRPNGSHFLQTDVIMNCELRIHCFSSPFLESKVASTLKNCTLALPQYTGPQRFSGRINWFYGIETKHVFAFREPRLGRRRGWVSHGVIGQTQGLSPSPRPIEDLLPFRYSWSSQLVCDASIKLKLPERLVQFGTEWKCRRAVISLFLCYVSQ
jgi:hypothetical protein